MDQETPSSVRIDTAFALKNAKKMQASLGRILAEGAQAKRQTANTRLADVAQAVGTLAEAQQEFALVRACRQHVKGYNSTVTLKTEADYLKKAKRLDDWRPDPDSPPDLSRCPSANSYYPYRAAAIWTAREECQNALRQREKLPAGSPERREVMRRLHRAFLTLEAYPAGDQNIARFKQQEAAAKLGLETTPASCPLGKRNPRASKAKVASKLLRTQPKWATQVWNRLEAIASPWRDQVAVMALTGCRPQEVFGVTIELGDDGALVFLIQGAKTDDHKGQPWRRLTVKADRPEFAHLVARIGDEGSLRLPVRAELKDPADALGTAVRRAGAQALGAKAGFSAYVYRHSMAADLKADKLNREDIAWVLGHSVTETASLYGYWQGGTAGVRQVVAEAQRVAKMNHWHGKLAAPPPSDPPAETPALSSSRPLPSPPARRTDAPSCAPRLSPISDEPKPY